MSLLLTYPVLFSADTFNYMTGNERKDGTDMNGVAETRKDPVMQLRELHINNFDVYHYLTKYSEHDKEITDNDFILKTQVYYLIKFNQIYGTLTIRKKQMVFEPDLKAP